MASVYTGAFIPRDEGFDVSVNGMGQISIVPAGGSADIHICMSPAEAITFGERLLAAARAVQAESGGGGMSGVDVLEVMDSEYWMVYGQLHSLCHAANHDERHGQVSTKHVLACLDGTGAAIDAAVEARSAVAELIEANTELEEANADPRHTMGRDLRVINAEVRARAALARCRGGGS